MGFCEIVKAGLKAEGDSPHTAKSAFCILHVWFGSGAAAAVGTNISSKKGNCTLLLLAKLSFLHFTFTFNPYTYML